jgi:hypothetical protein
MPRSSKTNKRHAVQPASGVASRPPQLVSNTQYRHTYRFAQSGSGSLTGVATAASLNRAAGVVVVTANTTARGIAQAVKIHRVRIWSSSKMVSGTSVAANIALDWGDVTGVTTNQFQPNTELMAASTNPSVPAFIDAAPPVGSAASFWQPIVVSNALNTTIMFRVLASTDVVVDVDLSVVLADGVPWPALTITSGGVGTLLYGSLDGVAGNYDQLGVSVVV